MSTLAAKPRLLTAYKEQVAPALKEELGLSNVMAVPRIEKIVLNMGVGDAVQNKRFLEDAVYTLEAVTGQKSVITKAR